MTKKRPIVPGELYYPIEIDPFSTPASDSKYPLALENVTSWVYDCSGNYTHNLRAVRISLGEVVVATRPPGEGELVGQLCAKHIRLHNEYVEIIYDGMICAIKVHFLFPANCKWTQGTLEASRERHKRWQAYK